MYRIKVEDADFETYRHSAETNSSLLMVTFPFVKGSLLPRTFTTVTPPGGRFQGDAQLSHSDDAVLGYCFA